ncbi:MAG: glycosyltransferase family 39 protein [bacterium]|nr:glycosyltransferase family 39 protein [bacterium]
MKTKTVILLIIILSAAIRFYNIDQKNLWFDEIYSWKISQGDVVQIVSETSGDIHPPLYYTVLKNWNKLFSDSVISMRILSVLFSLLSIFFIYRISKLFFKDDLPVIMILLMYAVSPLNIYYSQEVRMLNLNLLLCLGSVYFFYCFINKSSGMNGLLYTLFTVLAIYTHYFAFLILFTEVVVLMIFYLTKNVSKLSIKKYAGYFLVINIFYLPWYPTFFQQISKGQPWRTQQSFYEVAMNTGGYLTEIFLSPYIGYESMSAYYVSLLVPTVFLTFLIVCLIKLVRKRDFTMTDTISLFFFIPLLIAAIISFNQSIVFSRYLSIIVPFLLILIVYYSFKSFKRSAAVAIILFFTAASIYGTKIYYNNNFKNNDYRRIISYIEKDFKPEDEIIAEPHFMGWCIDYHIAHSGTNLKQPNILGWDMKMQLDSLGKRQDMNNLWFISDYSSRDNKEYDSLNAKMSSMGYERISEKMFYLVPAKVKVNYYRKRF